MKAKPSRATSATASERSCTTIGTTCPRSRCTHAPTHDSPSRSSSVSISSSLSYARSQLTGMTPDRVAASIASFDFLYLTELERQHIVAPTVRSSDSRVYAAQQGGHVLEPAPGLHSSVWVFDFKSLYPSIIRTFNIDPLSYVASPVRGRRSHRDTGRFLPPIAGDSAAHAR